MSSDDSIIRIGTQGVQTAAYIAGISATSISGAPVIVDSNGQLGIQTSAIRFKEQVRDIENASDALMQLRPVSFRYKQSLRDGSKPLQYGLIAEEVEKVYPELIVYDDSGQVESVKYQELPVLMLAELQKQHKIIEQQKAEIGSLESRLSALETALNGAAH